jgi:hypothetical protein
MPAELIPFHRDHAALLENLCAEDERWRGNDFPNLSWRARIEYQGVSGPAYSVVRDGEVLACGGIAMHHPGVGELWMATSKGAKPHGAYIALMIVRHLDNIAVRWGLHRVQVTIPEGGEEFSRRIVERLGFVRETKDEGMRKYAQDGSTCHLYARIY